MKGIHREIQKLQASDVDKHIINSRVAVSEAEFQQSSAREQQVVLARWHELRFDPVRKQTKKDIFGNDILKFRTGVKDKDNDKTKDNSHAESYVRKSETEIVSPIPRSSAHAYAPGVLQQVASYDGEELEKAIQESVKATSNGNPEEDRVIERAVRASVSEIQYVARSHPIENVKEEEAFQQAIRASMAEVSGSSGQEVAWEWGAGEKEAGETRKEAGGSEWEGGAAGGSWLTDDPELEQALHKSLIEQGVPPGHVGDAELERALRESRMHGGTPEDEFERALRESRRDQKSPEVVIGLHEENDEELRRAIEESKKLDEEKEAKRRAEEQVIMEYVMKASLEEQEYQRRRAGGSGWGSRA